MRMVIVWMVALIVTNGMLTVQVLMMVTSAIIPPAIAISVNTNLDSLIHIHGSSDMGANRGSSGDNGHFVHMDINPNTDNPRVLANTRISIIRRRVAHSRCAYFQF